MRVLILEPQQDFGDLLKKSLGREGMVCDLALNAQDAIHITDHNKPDVAVVELNLAGHNGLEFLYELRSHSDWGDIPVVIFSHISSKESGLDQKMREKLGIVDYLYKPLTTLDKLQNVISGAMLEPSN